jgi:hypothetical protein
MFKNENTKTPYFSPKDTLFVKREQERKGHQTRERRWINFCQDFWKKEKK